MVLWAQGHLGPPWPAAGGKEHLEGGSPTSFTTQGWLQVERNPRCGPSSEGGGRGLHLTLPTGPGEPDTL